MVPDAGTRSLDFAKAGFAFVGVACVLAPLAYTRMFTGFYAYDDEGIFLVALRDYLAGHPLMTPYVPLYGPFYYEVYGAIFKLLGIAPAHDSGRWLTLVVWLVASAAGGLVVWMLTRSRWLALAGQLVTFSGLGALTHEPMSTYGLSSLLLLALAGISVVRSTRPRAAAVLIGTIVAALWLIKVNLGVFAALAVAFAWTATLPRGQRRLLLPAFAVAISMFPLLLTSSLWRQTWVVEFAIVVALSAAALGVAGVFSEVGNGAGFHVRWMLGGGLLTLIVCLLVALAGGSQPADIVNFFFVFPLRFPQVFTFPLDIGPVEVAWAALSLIGALAVMVMRPGLEVPAPVRIAGGLFTWLSILLVPSSAFLLALPLVWLASRPPHGDRDPAIDPTVRLLIPALALLESLQAYPVAGTQVSLAAVGLMPVGAILLYDGIRQARTRGSSLDLVAPAAVAMNVIAIVVFGLVMVSAYQSSVPLDLPGAHSVRVDSRQASALHGVVDSIDAHGCSYVITYPGMDSFYVWTDDQSSLRLRYGQWYLILSPDEQRAIVAQLQGQPGLCVVKNQAVLDFWTLGRPPPSGPLVDFVNHGFVPAGTSGDYELLVRAGS